MANSLTSMLSPLFDDLPSLLSKWRDALALGTLWMLSVGVITLCWLLPLWQHYQAMVHTHNSAQQQYEELQLLTAFLPSEQQPLARDLPTLVPSHKQAPVVMSIGNFSKQLTHVSGGCGEIHRGFTIGWQECRWVLTGNQQTIGTIMNQLAQQPAWVMTQARVLPQGDEWKLSIAGNALVALQ